MMTKEEIEQFFATYFQRQEEFDKIWKIYRLLEDCSNISLVGKNKREQTEHAELPDKTAKILKEHIEGYLWTLIEDSIKNSRTYSDPLLESPKS